LVGKFAIPFLPVIQKQVKGHEDKKNIADTHKSHDKELMRECSAHQVIGICSEKENKYDQDRDQPIPPESGNRKDNKGYDWRTQQELDPVCFYEVGKKGNQDKPFKIEIGFLKA
jgi:hypothetical protein